MWILFSSVQGNQVIMNDDGWSRGDLHYQIYNSAMLARVALPPASALLGTVGVSVAALATFPGGTSTSPAHARRDTLAQPSANTRKDGTHRPRSQRVSGANCVPARHSGAAAPTTSNSLTLRSSAANHRTSRGQPRSILAMLAAAWVYAASGVFAHAGR